jgi:thiol-disulfide isomerase/thioredoxin
MAKIVLLCCVILQLAFVSERKNAAFEEPKPLKVYAKEGIKVPAYDFKSLEYFLNKKNDTTYVVNFWATWCGPCVAELPHFEKLNDIYKGQKVKVLLISLDMKKKIESNLIPFIKKKNLKSDVMFLDDPNANDWIGKVDANWSGAIPATIIFNKSERKFYEQSFTFEALEKELKQFIK